MSDENSERNRLYRYPAQACASQRPEGSERAGAVLEHATIKVTAIGISTRNMKDARKSFLSVV